VRQFEEEIISSPKPTDSLAEDRPPEPERPAEIPYNLVISADKLKAYISGLGDPIPPITTEDLRNFLREKGISYGLVDDSVITEYLNREGGQREPLLIAEGHPPRPGKDAQVTFFFEKEPSKIGRESAGGSIDFKDKGKIAQVKPGALLAEKVPLVKAEAGKDVYGNPVPVEDAKDVFIHPGTGTEESADGLKIYAKIGGRPDLLAGGRLCVFSELKIDGDIGLETGYVDFDGFINVSGTVQEGFKVRGGRLAVKEIYRAEVEIDGDVVVDGGVIGAKIDCGGSLRAKYIRSSHVEALGDVNVEGEIIESQIETGGVLSSKSAAGKILSSRIIAKKGIEAHQIGSDASKPCTLTIGADLHMRKRSGKLKETIVHKEEEKKKTEAAIEKLKEAGKQLQGEIAKLAHTQDRALAEQRSCKKKTETLKANNDQTGLIEAEKELKALGEKARGIEEPLGKLMDQQDQLTDKISVLQRQVAELEGASETLQSELQAMIDESKRDVGIPAIRVYNQIFSGTTVEGLHALMIVKENTLRVLIKETKVTHPEGKETFELEMKISDI
jgi:uncharacterized protein (DUF342 family)